MDRRKFIGVVAGGMSLLAGCESPRGNADDSESDRSEVDVEWPEVSSQYLSDWTRTGERKDIYSESKWGVDVTGHERTHIYENETIRESLKDKTLGNFDQTLATFFATRIDLRGYATALVSNEKLAEQVLPSFEEKLSEQGIQNVQTTAPKRPQPNIGGDDGALIYEYTGRYPVPKFTKTVDIEEIGERELTIPAGSVTITGLVVVWKDGHGTGYVAGGAFPAGDYEEQGVVPITSDEGDGIDVVVKIDLNIEHRELRREVIDLIEGVN